MPDPTELLKRAAELHERASLEKDPGVRETLLSTAEHYSELAESESWLAEHSVSLAGVAGSSKRKTISCKAAPY